MDIHSLSSLLASQNSTGQQNSTQTSASQLSQLLSLEAKSGSLIQAFVTEVIQLSPKDQQALLLELKAQVQQLSASLNQATLNSSPPEGTRPSGNDKLLNKVLAEKSLPGLESRIQLLEKVIRAQLPLQLINLKAGKESVLTLSEKSFSVGESLSLRVRADGQLSFVSNKPLPAQQQKISEATADDLKRNMQILGESLRQHLPLSANNKRSLDALDKLLQNLIKIERPIRASLLPPETQKLLGKLSSNVFTPAIKSTASVFPSSGPLTPGSLQSSSSGSPALSAHLSSPVSLQQVKQAINQSGNFLESNIRKLIVAIDKGASQKTLPAEQSVKNYAHTPIPSRPGLQTTTQLQELTKNKIANTIKTSANVNAGSVKTNLPINSNNIQSATAREANTVEDDNKAILLKLLDQLNNLSQQNIQANVRAQASLRDPLLAILKSLGIRPQKDTATHQLQKNLITELKHLVSTTLSRIQTLQLRTLAQGTNDIATALLPTIELSLRVNDNIYPFLLYFQEKPLKNKNLEEEEKDQKKRKRKLAHQWKVFMQFEMDDCGWFASEVSMLDERVTTRFWAQKNNTQKRLSSRLDELKKKMEDSGLLVDDIVLLPGEPPRPNTQVQQHLVDVQT